MLTEHFANPAYVSLGCHMTSIPDWGGSWTALATSGSCVTFGGPQCTPDHLGRDLLKCEVLSPRVNIVTLSGHDDGAESDGPEILRTYVGLKPVSYSKLLSANYGKWSRFIFNAKALFSDWNFENTDGHVIMHENPVSHFNIVGEVRSGITPSDYYRDPFGHYNDTMPNCRSNFALLGDFTGVGLEIDTQELLPRASNPGPYWLQQRGSSVMGDPYAGGDPHSWYGYYTDIVGEGRSPSITSVQYLHHYQMWDGVQFRRTTTCVRFEYVMVTTPCVLPLNESYPLALVAYMEIIVRVKRIAFSIVPGPHPIADPVPAWHNYHVPSVVEMHGEEATPYFLSPISYFGYGNTISRGFRHLVGYDHWNGRYRDLPDEPKTFVRYSDQVAPLLNDLYQANFFSTKEAIDNYYSVLASNHLETLSEIGDLFSLVSIAHLLRALHNVRKSVKNPFPLIVQILHILADAKLIYSFGIAPTLSDAKDIAKRSGRLSDILTQKIYLSEQTMYGKYELPLEYSESAFMYFQEFPGTRLIARSKVRGSVEPDSFLSAVFPVYQLGLLPTLSNLWDILPFSFLVDWFTGIGTSLEAVDTQAMLLSLSVSSITHSISVEYEFEVDALESHDSEAVEGPNGPGLTGYRYYDRYVTSRVPILGPSRIPIFQGGGVPDWGTASSLFWKLIVK